MKIKAHAKINLGLKVISKRSDGYHNLETIMTEINLYDLIHIFLSDEIRVYCKEVDEKDNLSYKVATFMKEKYHVEKGATIYIDKKIPIQAGLGGGSSDAASTIKALNKMWKLNLSVDEMLEISNMFGSDIAYFIYDKPAFVTGRGENIETIKIKRKLPLLLIKPDEGFVTKEIYSNIDSHSKKDELTYLLNDLAIGAKNLNDEMSNDLEKGLSKEKAILINSIKNDLKAYGATNTMMSGAGSSVFGIFLNKNDRNKAYKKLKLFYKEIYKVHTI